MKAVLLFLICSTSFACAQLSQAETDARAYLAGVYPFGATQMTSTLSSISSLQASNAFANTNLALGNMTNGVYFRSNAFSPATIRSSITNGSAWMGMLSNALQVGWMSNNVILWKKLAP